ncbi:MAG: NAD-dependent protein deacylase [Clostridia bacterium]
MYEKAANLLKKSGRIVFFTGAGVSTESGIPDFRSKDGLYSKGDYEGYPPEEILSLDFFHFNTPLFYRFYRDHLVRENVMPNPCHMAIAQIEKSGKDVTVITQNIDGLHQKAGSGSVLELHGSINRNYCMGCGQKYGLLHVAACEGVPLCGSCGGVVRPEVTLYGEMLDEMIMETSWRILFECDMLFVMGTSLTVYPAASLVNAYAGNRLILINRGRTSQDHRANLLIDAACGQAMSKILEEYRKLP